MLAKATAGDKANAFKVQVFSAAELAVPSYKHYKLFKPLAWPETYWKELINFIHDCGLIVKIFADVFGSDSVAIRIKSKKTIRGEKRCQLKLLPKLHRVMKVILPKPFFLPEVLFE